MIHFKDKTTMLMDMSKEEKKAFLADVDLTQHDFECKLADYGLSKKLKKKENTCKLTCGTMLYMSPQCLFGNFYSYKLDIWSIGCMLCYLIDKKTPFQAGSKGAFEDNVKGAKY